MTNPRLEEYIKHSNLIEGVHDPKEVDQSMSAWNILFMCDELTEELVLETHQRIMYRLLPSYNRGTWRDCWVTVGGRVCPMPILVPGLMHGWLGKMSTPENYDPKEMHIEYEKIHPFVDGNGRTGRMFMWWHELMIGYPLTFIDYEKRWDYFKWFDDND